MAVLARVLLLIIFAFGSSWLSVESEPSPQYTVVFEGYPTKKVETGPDVLMERSLSPEESDEFAVRIVVDQEGNYFWASREMKPMVKVLSGSYVTYAATSGYVRTYMDDVLDMARAGIDSTVASIMGLDHSYEYVEHLYIFFGGINYYGERRDR